MDSCTNVAPAGDEVTAFRVSATAGDAARMVCLEELSIFANGLGLVPAGLDHMNIVLADDDLVATENLTTDEVSGSFMEESTVDSASYSDYDDASCAPKLVASTAAVAAVDTLRMFLGSSARISVRSWTACKPQS